MDIGDGWEISSPSAESIEFLELVDIYRQVYAHPRAWSLKSMLVIRDGKLIAESYFKNDMDRTNYNAIWSCTKQINAIATGIAIDQGYISSVEDSIKSYLAEELVNHQDKKDITIKQLLTMTAGIYFDNDVHTNVLRNRAVDNSVEYVLDRPLRWAPGSHFHYNDALPQLISAIIQKRTGMSLAEYTNQVLFSKIGLTRWTWIQYPDGLSMGAFGLAMPPRELAKVAWCVCNGGIWGNERVIPQSWMQEMLAVHVPNLHNDIGMGYYWWTSDTGDLAHMWGHGGQYAVIIPSKKLVVVFTAIEQLSGDFEFGASTAIYYAKKIAEITSD